eukprot:TRINITY_DN3981_c0_g1_i1.p1 TRINITY_DN3981_c0_g1~~TRINITY_DN3981_c0_g1_i1.p1  ORF type:complete len:122 (-),score=20.33 TRINITY_DN3981_c0_g1_i1:281-646(-)
MTEVSTQTNTTNASVNPGSVTIEQSLESRRQLTSHPLVRTSDMDDDSKLEAVESVVTALERFPNNYENASKAIKEAMDKKTGGSGWHCVIGEGFGFEINHEVRSLLYMFHGNVAILLFKCI